MLRHNNHFVKLPKSSIERHASREYPISCGIGLDDWLLFYYKSRHSLCLDFCALNKLYNIFIFIIGLSNRHYILFYPNYNFSIPQYSPTYSLVNRMVLFLYEHNEILVI
jgi:hypothetical protein